VADKIPSLGDETPVKLVKVRETFPLPKGRKAILSAVERIMNLGGVLKITVEFGSPIKVTRAVEPGAEPPEELQDDDLMAAVRNSEMEEFVFTEPLLPTNYLFRAFHLLSQRRLQSMAVVVNNVATLKKWLVVERAFDLVELFGVPVRTHKEMPDDGLLIVAARPDDMDTVAFSLKLAMDIKEKK
jgi:hypothetical protein